MAQLALTQFEEHPESWTRVPEILEKSTFPQAKVRNILLSLDRWLIHRSTYSLLACKSSSVWLPHVGRRSQNPSDKVGRIASTEIQSYPIFSGIRNFIVGETVKVASDDMSLRRERTYLNKLNLVLVQVCT
jgi:exportin-1